MRVVKINAFHARNLSIAHAQRETCEAGKNPRLEDSDLSVEK